MNDLLTGLNGGNVPTLDVIILLTLVALLPSLVYQNNHHDILYQECHGSAAESAEYGSGWYCPFSDPLYHEPGTRTDQ